MRTRLRFIVVVIALAAAASAGIRAHDLERTQVSIAFARDGAFIVDVSNDPAWLLMRLEPFAAGLPPHAAERGQLEPRSRDQRLSDLAPVFIDRIVIFVDGHEVRPTSIEYVPPALSSSKGPALSSSKGPRPSPGRDALPQLATYRLRGRVAARAATLRWFYGLVIDPYPLTVRYADGDSATRWIDSGGWSAPFELTTHLRAGLRADAAGIIAMLALAAVGLTWRAHGAGMNFWRRWP